MHAVLVPIYLLLITPITFSWWPAGSQLLLDPVMMCLRKRQSKKMQEICKDPPLMQYIGDGVRLAQEECQWQFRHRRWNCTSLKRSIKNVILNDTRETGFVNAIIAAGITYTVTRACTTGELQHKCSCDFSWKMQKKDGAGGTRHPRAVPKQGKPQQEAPGDWRWSGCGENVNYGVRKSKDFLDSRYKHAKNDIKTLIKLHNYSAGRMAIKKHMHTQCKCHGLSGSCTMKSCWKKMPTFREIGDRLKEHFDGAAKVIPGNDGHSFVPEGDTIKPPNRENLVYLEESIKYCNENLTLGSLGTRGRTCNATSLGEEGCDILCCGRGYQTVRKKETINCNCEFKWCCNVVCQTCEHEYDEVTCR